jgi:hypothetical protein
METIKLHYSHLRNEAHAEYNDTLAATIARHTAAAKRRKRRRGAVARPALWFSVSSLWFSVL